MEVAEKQVCYHCGEACVEPIISANDKTFCCEGCKLVYELLDENGLCEYYQFESHPGAKASTTFPDFEHFDSTEVRSQLLTFDSVEFARAKFHVPSIHCSSCIWLLENLTRMDKGVSRSEVNFNRKELDVDFDPRSTSLSRIAGQLASIGYAPRVQLTKDSPSKADQGLVIKLGVAGFVFGNVMLFSFPEYLGLDSSEAQLGTLFSWLNLLLSIPVLIYSASDYFTSATKTFRQRQINIDVPIALGLVALFFRSAYDILTGTGPGYLDSFTGLVFFLLIGRWFQSRTFDTLSFERDFKSYFPLAVQRLVGEEWKSTLISLLRPGDQIRVRNLEVVPADSELLSDEALIDYSFVTGEAKPISAANGEMIYAGGRLLGKPVSLRVLKDASNSHLTSLWNHEAFRKKSESHYKKIIDRAARKFTWIVLAIAVVTAVYWYFYEPAEMWLVLTSVLMVACPCALALAAPFTYGTMLSSLGKSGFYLKNADTVERLACIDAVVFDKTGTITHGAKPRIEFSGSLTEEELAAVKLLASGSTHPLSVRIAESIDGKTGEELLSFREYPSKGIEGQVGERFIRIGSYLFVGADQAADDVHSRVFVSIDGELKGHFAIRTTLRESIAQMLTKLGKSCRALLSGDNENERERMASIFPLHVDLRFNQSASDKMDFISRLKSEGRRVMMVGDGLNDAGALKHADVGIAVTDDAGMFTPGCDAILQGERLRDLDKYLSLARKSTRILKSAFVMSFAYNAVALSFAVTGHLSPLVAAILMPVSSISVVSFSSIGVMVAFRRTFPSLVTAKNESL